MFQAIFRVLALCCVLGGAASAAPAGAVELVVPDLRWVLLAPSGGGPVQLIEVGRAVRPLASLHRRGRGAAIALAVQREPRRVWVLADDGLDVHAASSGRLLGHWSFPQGACAGRLEAVSAGGPPRVWCGPRGFDAVAGAAVLVPARAH